MSKRSHDLLLSHSTTSKSGSSTAAAAASSTSSSSESAAKRPKFADLVANVPLEYGGAKPTTSSIGGVVLGELPPEPKSRERMELDGELDADEEAPAHHMTAEEEMDAILQLVNDAPEVAELDLSGARLILARFHKAVEKNLELRARYADQPTKFMDSELALDEACQALMQLSSQHAFYPLLLERQGGSETTMDTLCTLLLQHENIDVSIDSLNLLHELVDAEELGEGEEELEPLIAYVTGANSSPFLTTLVRALSRFPNEHTKENADAVTHILAILENATDLAPKEVSERLVKDTNIIEWTMLRLKADGFNANKLYASEILSILLTNVGVTGQNQLGSTILDGLGIKTLIRLLARYRKEDPSNDEETEYVENLFDILCLSLHHHPENQKRFAANDGIQLMLTMIRRNTYAKTGAFKAIDYALQRCASSCDLFIDEGGLKTLFAAYMHEPTTKKERADQTSNEQHLLEILTQLFLNCVDIRYLRLRRKFEENEMVKTERTVELLVKYQTRVDDAERKYQAENKSSTSAAAATSSSSSGEPTVDELTTYARQTDHGLGHVELATIVLAFLATSGNKELHARIEQLLNQQDLEFKQLQRTLQTYTRMMGDAADLDEEQKKTKEVLQALASMIIETP